jgi:geranylgeranyl reductase family protein
MRAIVIGAGPGGATAALALARAGATVTLLEQSAWPRPKTCGDGVSPLAIREAQELGAPFPHGLALRSALITTPGARAFRGAFPAATPYGTIVERRTFDAALVDAAIAHGAEFTPATKVRDVAHNADGVVVSARSGDRDIALRADVALIAEGATGGLAHALGFPAYRSRLIAIRGYVSTERSLVAEYGIFYDRLLSPGYGWIFPVDDHRANVGVCVDEKRLAATGGNARELLHRWLAENRYVRERFGTQLQVEDERGGVIPSGRARRARGRVLLVGDAAGVADPFTAEGILEAMHSGRLAAEALIAPGELGNAAHCYERSLRVFDRNERAARALRATFGLAIEPYAWYAASHAAFADKLTTDVFFLKRSFTGMLAGLHLGRLG